jgi:CheY-like chemotaxis protein
MPVMNGPTATKQLREMRCDSYIVGVTGNVMQVIRIVFVFMYISAGGYWYLYMWRVICIYLG